MSTEARNARLRTIWLYQHSLNATRAALLSKIPDDEHFRFVVMMPLPPVDMEEVAALARPPCEVLEEMRSKGFGNGGWDARDGPSGCEAGRWGSESESDGGFSCSSDESGGFMDSEEEEEEEEEEGEGMREDVEVPMAFLGDDICEDPGMDADVEMEKGDEDYGVESSESDDSAGSSVSTGPSLPEDDYLAFSGNLKATDLAELESPTSPASSEYSDPDPDPDSDSDSDQENAAPKNGKRGCPQHQQPEDPATITTPASGSEAPDSPLTDGEQCYPQDQEETTTIPPFTFEALDAPFTTAEVLFAFEAAYTDVYKAGAYVWHFSCLREDRLYQSFREGRQKRMAMVARRGGSKLRNEVLVEDLEDAWDAWGVGSGAW